MSRQQQGTQITLQVVESKPQKTSSGKIFTKLNCVFPDGNTYRVTIFEWMAIPDGATITGYVQEDQPYNGKRQFKLNQPIFVDGQAPGGAPQGAPPAPQPSAPIPGMGAPAQTMPAPAAMPSSRSGQIEGPKSLRGMSYDKHTDMMRTLIEDSFILIEEICMKRNLEVTHEKMLELACSRATSTVIAIQKGEVTEPANAIAGYEPPMPPSSGDDDIPF
jgi:hypothetical protein